MANQSGRPNHVNPPSVAKRAPWQDSQEFRVSNWIQPWDFQETIDAAIIGAPYSAASISASGAAGGPEAVRMAFRYNTTYSPDWDVDLQPLRVRDCGDISGHLTDVSTAHSRIKSAMSDLLIVANPFVPVLVGGDHSVTAPAIRGFCAANPGKQVGVINIDAHLDVRNLEHGPHNGTPFRQIIEGNIPVEGKNVVELGIHGFMNASAYMDWSRDQGVTIITGREIARKGIDVAISRALEIAGNGTDLIYLSVDIDCLAYPFAMGTSASSPEGMSAWDLLEAVFACGQSNKVAAMDIVEIDPTRDFHDLTARSGCSAILAFLAGLSLRLKAEAK